MNKHYKASTTKILPFFDINNPELDFIITFYIEITYPLAITVGNYSCPRYQ